MLFVLFGVSLLPYAIRMSGLAYLAVAVLLGVVYIGYAVSWLGVSSSDIAGQRAFRSACAGVAGILIVVGGLLLERACRVPPEDDEP